MKIHLTFGQGLDSARWSDKDSDKASLGYQKLGLKGMQSFLEHKLGIPGKEPNPAVRIAQYQRKLREYYKKNPGAWGNESFKADAWSTAKQLLAWRDELIEGGWNNKDYTEGVSERLDVLAGTEKVGPKLSSGSSDRLSEILGTLQEALDKDNTEPWPVKLTLDHPKKLFPPVWQKILDKLSKVIEFDNEPSEDKTSVGDFLKKKEKEKEEEKQVIQLEGNSQAELARHLVRYLTAAKKSRKLSKITLLACGDTRVLDGALHKGGFGAVGNVSPSAGRPSQALLTLFFSVMWEPIRVEQLYELIASPYLGIPNKDLIRKAIENAPGVGSEEWIKAWKEALAGSKNVQVFDELKEWLENPLVPLVPPEENASAEKRLEHSKQVIERLEELEKRRKWLYNRLNRRNKKDDLIHPELGTTISALRSLESVLDEYKQSTENITLIQLTRAIESLIGSGTPPASAEQEVTEFKIATNPGMVESTETLLWFDCVRIKPPRQTRWSKNERQYFETENVATDTAARRRKLDAYYRKRAFKNTSARIIFFVPETIDGVETARATFLNEVDYAFDPKLGEEAKKHIINAESLT
ncbi:MAG: hypothetical protein IJG02_10710, partial [Thermoguttaceae bacterium]|nr:hypothetical protein [Thermoguttaceae bacterium]